MIELAAVRKWGMKPPKKKDTTTNNVTRQQALKELSSMPGVVITRTKRPKSNVPVTPVGVTPPQRR